MELVRDQLHKNNQNYLAQNTSEGIDQDHFLDNSQQQNQTINQRIKKLQN